MKRAKQVEKRFDRSKQGNLRKGTKVGVRRPHGPVEEDTKAAAGKRGRERRLEGKEM